jgi:hypothetical protein
MQIYNGGENHTDELNWTELSSARDEADFEAPKSSNIIWFQYGMMVLKDTILFSSLIGSCNVSENGYRAYLHG